MLPRLIPNSRACRVNGSACERSIIVLRSATVPPISQKIGPSAPDKKSFTSVNSPILAWSVFTAIAGSAAAAALSEPKTPALRLPPATAGARS